MNINQQQTAVRWFQIRNDFTAVFFWHCYLFFNDFFFDYRFALSTYISLI